jgi:hypothetical protein
MSFLPLFIAFIVTIAAIWVGAISLYIVSRRGGRSYLSAYTLALSSVLGVPLGEAFHDAPRIPYMVLMGDGGIHVNALANSLIPYNMGSSICGCGYIGIYNGYILRTALHNIHQKDLADLLARYIELVRQGKGDYVSLFISTQFCREPLYREGFLNWH